MAEEANIHERTIILLGRTGTGKATVANQIAGTECFHIGTSLEGVTREVRSKNQQEKEATDEDRQVHYRIKTIDSVGPFGGNVSIDAIVTKIKELHTFSLSKEPRGIHLVLFVLREGAYTDEEIQAVQDITTTFSKKMKEVCALVITGCESLGEEAKHDLIQEIKTEEKVIAEFMGKGIHPVGFPSIETDYEQGIKSDAEGLRELAMNACNIVLPKDIFRIRDKVIASWTTMLIVALFSGTGGLCSSLVNMTCRLTCQGFTWCTRGLCSSLVSLKRRLTWQVLAWCLVSLTCQLIWQGLTWFPRQALTWINRAIAWFTGN